MEKIEFQNDLLRWFYTNKRVLPWRDKPTPYRVWISEIMLQQTRVAAVIPFFNKFTEELPNVEALMNVEEDKLLKLWEGLGYYNRARNLQAAANQIVTQYNGELPSTKEDLESLKGIGPYTSGAILSIAFNQKYSAVDGNVLRVFARLLGIRKDIKIPEIKKEIKTTVEALLPDENVGDFNQGLMEIGATICLPNGVPKCEECPLLKYCKAYEQGTISSIPLKRQKKEVPIEKKTVILLKNNNNYAIEKRSAKGLLASMYQFPLYHGHLSIQEVTKLYDDIVEIEKLPASKHKFTHKEWNMVGYLVKTKKPKLYVYMNQKEIKDNISIPTAFKTYKNML